MKRTIELTIVILLCFRILTIAQDIPNSGYEAAMKRTQWWREARFGMFIHFGLYAIPARGEWVKSNEKISNEDYQKYFDEFNPIDYNPREWAKIAKSAGMKYAVLTAKHHDGFALWDTQQSEYKSTNTPIKRDLVKDYLEAFRAEGLKVGLYFSLIDWHHADYPKFDDPFHPMRGNEKYKDEKINWDNYIRFMHAQVKELVSNYGKLDIIWFDFSYGEQTADKWKADELIKMVRSFQPDIIIDNRLVSDSDSAGNVKEFAYGDFETPEQQIPEDVLKDNQGHIVPWETCMTLNGSWGYNRNDNNWKSPEVVISTLVNCVSKNGNLLLNIGPDAYGNIPDESIRILGEVGRWMKKNSKSIYGCTYAEGFAKPEWGRFTQNGKNLYMHRFNLTADRINLKGFSDKIKKVRMLRDGTEIKLEKFWLDKDSASLYIFLSRPTYQNYKFPDDFDNVFEVELK
jgi:alpha-L-fucosidase